METIHTLPTISHILTLKISLKISFELAAARFACDEGTVVLLSGSDMDCARYHFLAVDPWLSFKGNGNCMQIEVKDRAGEWFVTCVEQNPFDLLKEITDALAVPDLDTDLPCAAGLFGYFSYDLKDRIEDLPQTCSPAFLPDICLYAPSAVLIKDRQTGDTWLNVPVFDGKKEQGVAQAKAQAILSRLDTVWEPKGFSIDPRGFTSSFSREEYIGAVSKVIQYLKAGDIYQANLSQRFETAFNGDTYSLFLELFNRNPAAFFSYINAGDHQVVSTSPERFIQVVGKQVETRPIKGTIARGNDPLSDQRNGEALASSLKDDAELTMIVDLMRNDISRVTEYGSVEVIEHKRLEPYENVFHLVSVVKGRLKEDKTAVDLIRATFPGGSITGCPKIRSMEIIDELEPVQRHVYTGSIGYLSFHGTMDLSIAIRTATVFDQRLVFSVGGGIVYDSDPEKEFQETLDKGRTIMETLLDAAHKEGSSPLKTWVNGKIADKDGAVVPVSGPAFEYGAGLFETIRIQKGRPLLLDAHILRLKHSWERLFDLPFPDISWGRVIDQLVRANRFETKVCALKIMICPDTRPGRKVYMAAFIRPYTHRLDVLKKDGLDLMVYPHPRFGFLADHKTMNYLFYDRAGEWAKKNKGDEALILNADLSVSETNTCNIFALVSDTLVIPDSDHVLSGVTLATLEAALAGRGYAIKRERLTVDRLTGLFNVMVANSLMGVVKVTCIDQTVISHEPGIVELMNEVLAQADPFCTDS